MRKNRKRSRRQSVVATNSMRFGAMIIMLFVMVIINLLASSSGTQISKSIGEKERQIQKLDADISRESARWEAMKSNESIEAALLRHGLSMKYPKAHQVVHMGANGQPFRSQLAVTRAGRVNEPVGKVRKIRRNAR